MDRPERELPLLAQTMRERGLHVKRVSTIDPRFINGESAMPYSITVWWDGEIHGHHRRLADHLARVEKIWHDSPRSASQHDTCNPHNTRTARTLKRPQSIPPDAPHIKNSDGTTRTYIVGKGWVDAI